MNDGLRLHEAYESERHGSFVNNDKGTVTTVPCADCGCRSAVIVGSAD